MSSLSRDAAGPPALVVTIDTEEEGLWRGVLRERDNRCRNVLRLPRLHALFRRTGARPTYLVDYAVATDADAAAVIAELSKDSATEIGAHLHPWCTPPFVAGGTRESQSYPHRLPPLLQREKLAWLCAALAERFGRWPTSYRAGRWGFDASTLPFLEELGITVDTSVRSLWWDPATGGPAFQRAPLSPYHPAYDDACRIGASGVLEVPTSAAFLTRDAARKERWVRWVPALPGLRRFVRRAGLRTLEVEDETLDDMCRVVDACALAGRPVLNISFHSSTLLAGETPYTPTERDVDAFLARLEGVIEHARGRWGAVPLRLSEVPRALGHDNRELAAPPSVAMSSASSRRVS
jgi:hypothetical protein